MVSTEGPRPHGEVGPQLGTVIEDTPRDGADTRYLPIGNTVAGIMKMNTKVQIFMDVITQAGGIPHGSPCFPRQSTIRSPWKIISKQETVQTVHDKVIHASDQTPGA